MLARYISGFSAFLYVFFALFIGVCANASEVTTGQIIEYKEPRYAWYQLQTRTDRYKLLHKYFTVAPQKVAGVTVEAYFHESGEVASLQDESGRTIYRRNNFEVDKFYTNPLLIILGAGFTFLAYIYYSALAGRTYGRRN